MIAFLTGRIAGRTATHALIDVGGVGYQLAMSTRSLAGLPADGDDVTVHTHLIARDDGVSLYGFESLAEKEAFEHLLTVSGVGPKVALAALSALSPDDLASAIAVEDVALVSSVPGIGKKTAQRIIIELADKIDTHGLAAGRGSSGPGSGASTAEARDALAAMGFSAAEIAAALKGAPAGADSQGVLKYALRRLGSGG